ncbi:asparagine synthase-related protein [Paenibacillus cellulositrophicus]|uniref:asparagine synthase-related protein n=1 Tax=Paenibacillus cellulositrophicus TaxID=562959 RepID=UPI00203B49DA|nr:asparagine synthetase B family protein [Paenibacillus cellulositrophicus]MCM2996928.1 asparagine synthase-related protein [Paenibacillus cellulositrophicus]
MGSLHKFTIPAITDKVKVILEGFCYNIDEPYRILLASDIETNFKKYGLNFLFNLGGEFSLVISDPETRKIYLVADPCGVKQAFYRQNNGIVEWSTNLNIFNDKKINNEYIANLLTGVTWINDSTPYIAINRVPAGHILELSQKDCKRIRYWKPENIKTEIYTVNEAYEKLEYFLTKFLEARISLARHPCFEVSGGLDSSTLFAIAKKSGLEVSATSIVFEGSRDQPYVNTLKQSFFSPWIIFNGDLFPAFSESTFVPNEPYTGFIDGLNWGWNQKLKDHDIDLVISGAGGDQVFGVNGNYYFLADLLKKGRIVSFLKSLPTVSYDSGERIGYVLKKYAIFPLSSLKLVEKGPYKPAQPEVPQWINTEFSQKYKLPERIEINTWHRQIHGFALRRYLIEILAKFMRYQFYGDHDMAKQVGIEKAYPYMDRIVIETMLKLDISLTMQCLFNKKPIEKWLLRLIAERVLPREVAFRTDKATFDPLWYKGFKLHGSIQWQKIYETAELKNYFEMEKFKYNWDRMAQGFPGNPLIFNNSVGFARWLQKQLN